MAAVWKKAAKLQLGKDNWLAGDLSVLNDRVSFTSSQNVQIMMANITGTFDGVPHCAAHTTNPRLCASVPRIATLTARKPEISDNSRPTNTLTPVCDICSVAEGERDAGDQSGHQQRRQDLPVGFIGCQRSISGCAQSSVEGCCTRHKHQPSFSSHPKARCSEGGF